MICNNTFVLTFLLLSSSVICSATQSQSDSRKLNESVQDYLKKVNKPAVKTIKSPDGDLVDCVLFDQQPGFDHPLLHGQHNKTIPDLPELPKGYLPNNDTAAFDPETFQVWRSSGESCPENTVPIRRTTEEDVLRDQTFGHIKAMPDGYNQHEHAIGLVQGKIYGADATINVWLPQVENSHEVSFSQMWVMASRIDAGSLNSIEAGYRVLHGDKLPRIFVFWTRDAYATTGCYDSKCGYCQVDKNIAPGFTISPVSHYNSNQQELRYTVWKAPQDGNWWVAIKGVPIGYFPSRLFTLLGEGKQADAVEFGGEIVNTESSGQHTTTQMGNGHFPGEGKKRAAYIRKLGVVNSNNEIARAGRLKTVIKKPNCYGLQTFTTKDGYWGDYMYYGGPGRDGRGCT